MTVAEQKNINPILKAFFPVVDCIAELFGPACEVVLHDTMDLESSIIKIRNGHVTGRKEGDPMTDFGLYVIKEAGKGNDVVGNYYPRIRHGKSLKSNAVVIRNKKGCVVGIMCVNLDISRWQQAQINVQKIGKMIEEFVSTPEKQAAVQYRYEHFDSDADLMFQRKIDRIIREFNGKKLSSLPEDRERIIRALDEEGIFLMKKAVRSVAKLLNMSVPSVYRYLTQVRRKSRRKTERYSSEQDIGSNGHKDHNYIMLSKPFSRILSINSLNSADMDSPKSERPGLQRNDQSICQLKARKKFTKNAKGVDYKKS